MDFYWKKFELHECLNKYNSKVDESKYVVFQPWSGGFNNIRMSLEIAASVAFLLNRVLVLPPAYKIFLMKNINNYDTFFDISDIGIKVISFEQYCKELNVEPSFEEIEKISYTIKDDVVVTILSVTDVVPENFIHNRKIKNITGLENHQTIYFPKNLLGNFYLTIFSNQQEELCKYVIKHIHYHESFFTEAQRAIDVLGDLDYYSIHVRRNDNQYADTMLTANEIFNNIQNIIPLNSKLYIATDEKDKSFFNILEQNYQVYYYEHINHNVNVPVDCIGMIEQIICSRSKIFIGTKLSTFSNYIHRLRGYMSDIKDKRILVHSTFYETNTSEESDWWIANWAREYNLAWKLSEDNIQHKNSIFVSIASYRDSQLIDTIDSLLKNCSGEHDVVVGVCMQDTLEEYEKFLYKNHSKVKTIFVPYNDSKGVGWARNKIQQEIFSGEDYFLQIDSHSRACKNWDKILVQQLNNCSSHKAILSTYINHFDKHDFSEKYFNENTSPWLLVRKFVPGEKLIIGSAGVVESKVPILGFWVAAGFLFTRGNWTKEVVYNPNIYFSGEEDYISVLSHLKGWDVYVPEKSTIWHDYTDNRKESGTKYRPLHWEDHAGNFHNPQILKDLFNDAQIYENGRSVETFYELMKQISNYKEPTSLNIDVVFDWNKIPWHDRSKEVEVIIFAFFDKNKNELYRPDIRDKDILDRKINIKSFEIEKNIHDQIYYCCWFVKYMDGSMTNRIMYMVDKQNTSYFL